MNVEGELSLNRPATAACAVSDFDFEDYIEMDHDDDDGWWWLFGSVHGRHTRAVAMRLSTCVTGWLVGWLVGGRSS